MLAAIRKIKINGIDIASTPAVIPSFSSKGFPEVEGIIKALSQAITEGALVSAYDIAHQYVKEVPAFPQYLILDSGGYESSKDFELSDTRMNNYAEVPWAYEQLIQVLDNWSASQPTLAVSYDHPKHRLPIKDQIAKARELFAGRTFGKEILLKPTSPSAARIDVKQIVDHIYDLREFDVIGFTEKELGYSLFDRMKKIAAVRQALNKINLNTPIHIFGSLDTISTPLYFLAGADMFDGLTWLRYCYMNGQAVYQKNAAALQFGIHINDHDIDPRIWQDNYLEIVKLELAMKRYVKEKSFAAFDEYADFFEKSFNELNATL
jgi:hypothetical protein